MNRSSIKITDAVSGHTSLKITDPVETKLSPDLSGQGAPPNLHFEAKLQAAEATKLTPRTLARRDRNDQHYASSVAARLTEPTVPAQREFPLVPPLPHGLLRPTDALHPVAVEAFWRSEDKNPEFSHFWHKRFELNSSTLAYLPVTFEASSMAKLALHVDSLSKISSNLLPWLMQQREFHTIEQFLMMAKAAVFRDENTWGSMCRTIDPDALKKLGRKVQKYDDDLWVAIRERVCVLGNVLKFSQNAALLERLRRTGTSLLAEASPYDKVWGIGLHPTDPKISHPSQWLGQNLAGKCLMFARTLLAAESDEVRAVGTPAGGIRATSEYAASLYSRTTHHIPPNGAPCYTAPNVAPATLDTLQIVPPPLPTLLPTPGNEPLRDAGGTPSADAGARKRRKRKGGGHRKCLQELDVTVPQRDVSHRSGSSFWDPHDSSEESSESSPSEVSSDTSDSSVYPQLKKQLLLIYDKSSNSFLWQLTPTEMPELQFILLPDQIAERYIVQQMRLLGLVLDEENVKYQGTLRHLEAQCRERAPPPEEVPHHDYALLAQIRTGSKRPAHLSRVKEENPRRRWGRVPWEGVALLMNTPDELRISGIWSKYPKFYAEVITLGARTLKQSHEVKSLKSASQRDLSQRGSRYSPKNPMWPRKDKGDPPEHASYDFEKKFVREPAPPDTPDDDDSQGDLTPPPNHARRGLWSPHSGSSGSRDAHSHPSRSPSPSHAEGQPKFLGAPRPHHIAFQHPLLNNPVTPVTPLPKSNLPRFSPGGSFANAAAATSSISLTEGRQVRKALRSLHDEFEGHEFPFDGQSFVRKRIRAHPLERYFQLWIEIIRKRFPHIAALDSCDLAMSLLQGLPESLRSLLLHRFPPPDGRADVQTLVKIVEEDFPQLRYDPTLLPPATTEVLNIVKAMMTKLQDYTKARSQITTEELGRLVHALDAEERQASLILTVYPDGRAGDRSVARDALQNLFLLRQTWHRSTAQYLSQLRATNDNIVIAPQGSQPDSYPRATDEEFVRAASLTLRQAWAKKQQTEHAVKGFLGTSDAEQDPEPLAEPPKSARAKHAKLVKPISRNTVNLVADELDGGAAGAPESNPRPEDPAGHPDRALLNALEVLTVTQTGLADTVRGLRSELGSLKSSISHRQEDDYEVNAVGGRIFDPKRAFESKDDRTPEAKVRAEEVLMNGNGGLCFRYSLNGVCDNTASRNGGCHHKHVCHEGYLHSKNGKEVLVGCEHLCKESYIMAKRRARYLEAKATHALETRQGKQPPDLSGWPIVVLSAQTVPLPTWSGTTQLKLDEKAIEAEYKRLLLRHKGSGSASVNFVNPSAPPMGSTSKESPAHVTEMLCQSIADKLAAERAELRPSIHWKGSRQKPGPAPQPPKTVPIKAQTTAQTTTPLETLKEEAPEKNEAIPLDEEHSGFDDSTLESKHPDASARVPREESARPEMTKEPLHAYTVRFRGGEGSGLRGRGRGRGGGGVSSRIDRDSPARSTGSTSNEDTHPEAEETKSSADPPPIPLLSTLPGRIPDAPPQIATPTDTDTSEYSITKIVGEGALSLATSCQDAVLSFIDSKLPASFGLGKKASQSQQVLNLDHYKQAVSRLEEMEYWNQPLEKRTTSPAESDPIDPNVGAYSPVGGPDDGAPVPVNLVGDGANFQYLGTIKMENHESLPYMILKVYGVDTIAMIDSGSCASFLTSKFADRLSSTRPDIGLPFYRVTNSSVSTFGSSGTTEISRAMPLAITVGPANERRSGAHTMYVAPNSDRNLPWDVLLGIDFLTQWHATLSLDTRRITFRCAGPPPAKVQCKIYTRVQAQVARATTWSHAEVATVNLVMIPPRQSALVEVAPKFKCLRTEGVLDALGQLSQPAHMLLEPTVENPISQSESHVPGLHDPATLVSFSCALHSVGDLRFKVQGDDKGRFYSPTDDNDLKTWTVEVQNFTDEAVHLEPGRSIGRATLGYLPPCKLEMHASGAEAPDPNPHDQRPPQPASSLLLADTLALLVMFCSIFWTVTQHISQETTAYASLGVAAVTTCWTVIRGVTRKTPPPPLEPSTSSPLYHHDSRETHLPLSSLVCATVTPIIRQRLNSLLPSSTWWVAQALALCWGGLLHALCLAQLGYASLTWEAAGSWWSSLTPQAQLVGPACCWAVAAGLYFCLLLWCNYGVTLVINSSKVYRTAAGRVPHWILPYMNPMAEPSSTPGHAIAGGVAWLLVLGLSIVTAEIFHNPMVIPALALFTLTLTTATLSLVAFKAVGRAVATTLRSTRAATANVPSPVKMLSLMFISALTLYALGAEPIVTVGAQLTLARVGWHTHQKGRGGVATQDKSAKNFENSNEFYNIFPGVFSISPPDDRDPWDRAMERFQKPTGWSDKDVEYLKSLDWYQVLEKTESITREQFVKAGDLLLRYAELGDPVDFVEGPSPHTLRRQ